MVTTVHVNVSAGPSKWTKACQDAVTHLNVLFNRSHINVALSMSGGSGLTIAVITDPSIQGSAVHGRTSSEFSDSGKMLRAQVRLPATVTINTPTGIRDAGPGILEVIAAHEFVHALGHNTHNSLLMAQTMSKVMGDSAAQDKLKAGTVEMPPLKLSAATITALQTIWT